MKDWSLVRDTGRGVRDMLDPEIEQSKRPPEILFIM